MPENREQRAGARPRSAHSTADRVGAILSAAEKSANRMLEQTEERVRDRIAEGERAAQNRVGAAEAEAGEILEAARVEAAQVLEAGRADASQAVTDATSEALAIVARAQENADTVLAEARETAAKDREVLETRARELLRDARSVTAEVRSDGLEVVGNLREMGDALRANSERLLRDVQSIHSQMVARLDRVDQMMGTPPRVTGARRQDRSLEPAALEGGDVLDVPEFMPPR